MYGVYWGCFLFCFSYSYFVIVIVPTIVSFLFTAVISIFSFFTLIFFYRSHRMLSRQMLYHLLSSLECSGAVGSSNCYLKGDFYSASMLGLRIDYLYWKEGSVL